MSGHPESGKGSMTALWTFDLSPVTERLEKKGRRDAPVVESEFRRFAALWTLHPEEDLAPSLAVDEYWHEFVLDTKRYRAFCDSAFGGYVDHVPDDTGTGMAEEFSRAIRLYQEHFGAVDAKVWAEPGNSMKERKVRA